MKKILLSLVVIVAVAAIAGGATYSYFSSSAVSNDNTFGTGTLDLQVADGDESFAKSITASYGGANLAPGDILPEQTIQVNNDGTLNANHLDLTVTLTGDTDLAQYIVYPTSIANSLRFGKDKTGPGSVRFDVPNYTAGDLEYGIYNGLDGSYFYGPAGPANGLPTGAGGGMDRDMDGKVTLKDLAAGKIRITSGTINDGIAAGTTATLWANAQIDPLTGNDMQGKTVVATFSWELHQDASQF
ncbi:MAG TPA: TasA family protein [Candidatus Moranbacteria bacterium]|nr:TasA family protein [Candidatus Moranbacteria bacterium]